MALSKNTSKCCYFCDCNLPAGAAVPLFKVTKNKEFTGKSCFTADSIVLSELLKSVGLDIDAASASRPLACKKCSRKVVNCSTLFHELESIVKLKIATSNVQSVKRFHGNSPSGSTPDSKKAKDNTKEQEQRLPKSRARKSLFELNAAWAERESLEDAVANLMCLPVTQSESVSLVKVGSWANFKYFVTCLAYECTQSLI